MTAVLLIMAAGVALGVLLRGRRRALAALERCATWAVYLLLFLLGCDIGGNAAIMSALGALGADALAVAAAATLGSMLFSAPVYRWFFRPREKGRTAEPGTESISAKTLSGNHKAQRISGLLGGFVTALAFAAGVGAGWLGVASALTAAGASTYALWLLMLLVGAGVGGDPSALRALSALGPRVLLAPAATLAGSLAGAAAVAAAIGIPAGDSMAVGAGMGYYSLSSVLITEARGADLGFMALLANVAREIATLLLARPMALAFGKLAPVAAGGATSMDTTLPSITAASGTEYAMVSLLHGVALTLAVPFAVAAALAL